MLNAHEKENLKSLFNSRDGGDIQVAIQIANGANLTAREIQEVADPFLTHYPHSDPQQAIQHAAQMAQRYPTTFNNKMQSIANNNR
jgi:hypothetical protein